MKLREIPTFLVRIKLHKAAAILVLILVPAFLIALGLTSWNYSAKPIEFPVKKPKLIEDFKPLADVVYIALIDGLRYDVAVKIAEEGAGALALAYKQGFWLESLWTVMPSLSPAVRASVFTAAPPLLHGAVGYGYETANLTFPVDNLFASAKARGIKSVVIADPLVYGEFWEWVTTGIQPKWLPDGVSHEAFLNLVNSGEIPSLIYICYVSTDEAGHKYGGASTEYYETAKKASIYVLEDLKALESKNLTYVAFIFSDHGHLDEGGHGGPEEVVMHPFGAIVGNGVRTDIYPADVPIYQLGSTIAFALGVELPAYAQAPPLFVAFNASEKRVAAYMIYFAELRMEQAIGLAKVLGEAESSEFLDVISSVNETIIAAKDEYFTGNYTGAYEKAEIASAMADSIFEHLLNKAVKKEYTKRAVVIFTLLALYAALLSVVGRKVEILKRLPICLVFVAISIGALLALLYALGFGLSLSKYHFDISEIALVVLITSGIPVAFFVWKKDQVSVILTSGTTAVTGVSLILFSGMILGQPILWELVVLSLGVLIVSAAQAFLFALYELLNLLYRAIRKLL